jgi:hypothetical protein
MEMAFARMQAEAAQPEPQPETPPAEAGAFPGSPGDLHARRDKLLAAVAGEIGLSAAAPLQAKTFDTFLGYYDMRAEMFRVTATKLQALLKIQSVAIWQRDDLIARLRAGEDIPGVSYDAPTDSGAFTFAGEPELDESATARIREIDAAIKAQQLTHTFHYDESGASASVTPYRQPALAKTQPASTTPGKPFPEVILPVLYSDPIDAAPTTEAFDATWIHFQEIARKQENVLRHYADPTMIAIILHESCEMGLLDRIIASKDRRWLCEGTANYTAWKLSREFFGSDFAQRVYNLDEKLRECAVSQPKINLARWPTLEKQDPKQENTDLDRAHYVFATRAMFLLAQQHGDDALGQLWHDVAQTQRKKVTAATFAKAYRKRYNGDLAALVKAAERNPIPPPPAAPAATP